MSGTDSQGDLACRVSLWPFVVDRALCGAVGCLGGSVESCTPGGCSPCRSLAVVTLVTVGILDNLPVPPEGRSRAGLSTL